MTAPALRIVTQDGELLDRCPDCEERDDVIAGLEETVRRLGSTIQKLRRDRESEARGSEEWGAIEELFGEWKLATKHRRSKFTTDRFEAALPLYRSYGPQVFRKAIQGIAYDPFTRIAKNGHMERYDGWENLTKNAGAFERYANRAPRRDA